MMKSYAIRSIDRLKEELDKYRPIQPELQSVVEQRLRIESSYHSNAIEGNTLTLGETRGLILYGRTGRSKPMREYIDIEGHNNAVKVIEEVVNDEFQLNESFIRSLHKILLKEPYKASAKTPDGRLVFRTISIGEYKTAPNSVETSTGEFKQYTSPEQVKPAMSDLVDWYRRKEDDGERPVVIAAEFHYRFVCIHPFDDGNGRMARLLTNIILMKHGYTVSLIKAANRTEYFRNLENADLTGKLDEFTDFITFCCEYPLGLYLLAARGKLPSYLNDDDLEIALFDQSMSLGLVAPASNKDFAVEVLIPFYNYCRSKARKIERLFANVYEHISINTTGTDGEVKSFTDSSSELSLSGNEEFLHDHVALMNSIIDLDFSEFQGLRSVCKSIQIKNRYTLQECRWKFEMSENDINEEYSGRDLDKLKKIFDSILRDMIVNLKRIAEVYKF